MTTDHMGKAIPKQTTLARIGGVPMNVFVLGFASGLFAGFTCISVMYLVMTFMRF